MARGLGFEETESFNPYKFGFIGSSDTHIGAGSFDEKNFTGKFPQDGSNPEFRHSVPPEGADSWDGVVSLNSLPPGAVKPSMRRKLSAGKYSASGLAGVWADENTQDAIFDAIRRKETFGTSGPRITARMFAGYGFDQAMLADPDLVSAAYRTGVPQGGDLGIRLLIRCSVCRSSKCGPMPRARRMRPSTMLHVPEMSNQIRTRTGAPTMVPM